MLQAAKKNKLKTFTLVITLLFVLSLSAAVAAAFLNTNRDTRPAPDKVTSTLPKANAYVPICTRGDYKYYFRDDRDIIMVENTKTGYVWKTGVDVPFPSMIEEASDIVMNYPEDIKSTAESYDMTVKEYKELANTPKDSSFANDQYAAFANSLITVEYYTGSGKSMKTTRVSSGASKTSEGNSGWNVVDEANGEYVLECKFTLKMGDSDDLDLGVNVYVTFGEDGNITYDIPNKEITGKGVEKIANIILTPFLGTSGGATLAYDDTQMDWVKVQPKEITPGYALIPDGSGALVRFTENKTKFSDYSQKVYGDDPSTALTYYASDDNVVPIKKPVMPVFGISHGDGTQAAFVAYADKGDEYMSINAAPESTAEGEMRYTYVYPSFKYNTEYYQVINQKGDTYRKLQDDPNKFDIKMTYQFLSGNGSDGTPSADYVGMAKAYRQHLIDEGILAEVEQKDGDIPIRVDFLMADSKKGVFSTQEVEVTSTKDVDDILTKLVKDGVKNINTGLIGWQSKGQTLSKPNSTSYSSNIGSEGDFEDIMEKYDKQGIDISYSRDFATINEDMVSYYNTAAKHINTKYLELDKSEVLPKNVPVSEYGYAEPEQSAEWLDDLYDEVGNDSKSFTVDGITNILLGSYSSSGADSTISDAIKLYQESLSNIKKNKTKVNLVNPNKYLWKYADRYLQSAVGTSQFVYETDTVPFLQMILHGTMEVYAPYANFSFYSTTDQLRMIDYNICPSFVLTKEPSYLLASTASADFYSTEFEQYEKLVNDIYKKVNEPLSQVVNYSWDSRTVVEDGVIVNTYSKDGNVKSIIINYTTDKVTVKGNEVDPQSAIVIEGGVK